MAALSSLGRLTAVLILAATVSLSVPDGKVAGQEPPVSQFNAEVQPPASPPTLPAKGSKLSSTVALVALAVQEVPEDVPLTDQSLAEAYAPTKPLFDTGLLRLDSANRLQVYLRIPSGADLEALDTELSAAGVAIERVGPEGDVIQAGRCPCETFKTWSRYPLSLR